MMQPRSWPVIGVLTLGACGGGGTDATLDSAQEVAGADTSVAEAAVSDSPAPDEVAVDASVEAATVLDGPTSEIPDAPVVEALAADGSSGWCSPLFFSTSTQDASADGGTGRRYFPPTRFGLGPIFGTACPGYGDCESGGPTMAEEAAYDLDHLAANDIPITVFHFDGFAWSNGDCSWGLGDSLRSRLQTIGIRALLHYWGGCRGTEDFDRAYSDLGGILAGFYFDDGTTDALAKTAIDWAQARFPGDAEIVMKSYRYDQEEKDSVPGLAAYGHSCYVNDLPADFSGLRTGIERVFSLASTLPAPFNEFTAFDVSQADEETYFRRIHWGAMQPVMDHSPWQHASPWEPIYDRSLLEDYRYFSWLHYELVPYLHSYDWQAFETGLPILRDPDAVNYTTKIGDELFAAFVTEPGVAKLQITLPSGTWIDYWDESQTYTGTITYPVPLGHEPIFIKDGAIIPMQVSRDYTGHGTRASAGSLTVLVYPSGQSRFRYRDDAANRWIVLGAEAAGNALTLGTSDAPSQPLLYRVERWNSAPAAVLVCGTTVMVNGPPGQPPSESEDAVNGAAASAWFYDATARRLVVKAFPGAGGR
jgi:hypothetical protein